MRIQFVLILILVTAINATSSAQEKKSREFYLTTSSPVGGLGGEFKRSIGEQWYLRYVVRSLSFNQTTITPAASNNFTTSRLSANAEISVGLERRWTMSEHLKLVGGFNGVLGALYNEHKVNDPSVTTGQQTIVNGSQTYGLTLHMGTLYSLNEHLLIGALYEPYTSFVAQGNRFGIYSNMSTGSFKLLFSFRWDKKD